MTSDRKLAAAIANAAKATAINKERIARRPVWKCAQCAKEAPGTVHQMRKTYCSKACMAAGYSVRMKGEANPNYRDGAVRKCEHCGGEFKRYNKASRFCGLGCRDAAQLPFIGRSGMRDQNHDEMVAAFRERGAIVIDTSGLCHGAPDLIVGWAGAWHLVEVKNPKNAYGRRGLNKRQQKWAAEWKGSPVRVVYERSDVARMLAFEGME